MRRHTEEERLTTNGSAATLHDYLRVLRRRKWIIVAAIVLAPLAAVFFAGGGPPLYESSAQVLVNRQNLPGSLVNVNDPTQLDSTRLLATQAQFARLPAIALAALRSVGVRNGSPSDLLGASTVTPSQTSDYLTFTVSDASPTRATALATAYAQQYGQYWRNYQTKQFAAAHDGIEQRIHQLKAVGDTSSPLYRSLQEEADQLVAMEAVASSAATLVRPATGAARVGSHLARNVIFAFVLALFTGVGLAFLRDALDQRARSAHEIEDRLRLRLLGRLSRPPRPLRKSRRLVTLAEPMSLSSEQFRMLRTTVEFARGGGSTDRRTNSDRAPLRPGYRLMISSGVEGEGKSTTIANLAVAFARAGRDVTLVDLDFRRASLHQFFDVDAEPGFTDVVLGSAGWESVMSTIDVGVGDLVERDGGTISGGRLRFLPIGTSPLRAADDGVSISVGDVLDRLAYHADLVLIDAPPLLRVGDALSLTSHVDGLLLVASLGSIQTPMLDELRRVLDETSVAKLGFVLTGADPEGIYGYSAYAYHHRVLRTG